MLLFWGVEGEGVVVFVSALNSFPSSPGFESVTEKGAAGRSNFPGCVCVGVSFDDRIVFKCRHMPKSSVGLISSSQHGARLCEEK